jgi:IclR family acetate operon transcriptional repressor
MADEPDQNAPQYRVQSAFDALRLLEVIVDAQTPLNASEISTLIGQHRNRVFRLLRTLEEAGYVSQDEVSRAYRPTLKLIALGNAVARNTGIESIVLPIMERVQRNTNETVYLARREGDYAVAVVNLESNRANRISAPPGRRWPLGIGAAGQALLLTLPDVEDYLLRHEEMRADYERAREQFDMDQVTFVDGRVNVGVDEGVIAIAAPIKVAGQDGPLAIALAWPTGRVTARYEQFRHEILIAAAEIEREFAGTSFHTSTRTLVSALSRN